MLLHFLAICLILANSLCSAGIYSLVESGINSIEQGHILELHNGIRLKVVRGQVPHQPKGIDLKRLKWDQRLANKAQRIADGCNVGYHTLHDDRFESVGQNIYSSHSQIVGGRANWKEAVYNWYSEHAKYRYGRRSNQHARHYVQLVWACTEFIGCGYSYFRDDICYKKFYVCNYGPGMVKRRRKPYKTGKSGCDDLS